MPEYTGSHFNRYGFQFQIQWAIERNIFNAKCEQPKYRRFQCKQSFIISTCTGKEMRRTSHCIHTEYLESNHFSVVGHLILELRAFFASSTLYHSVSLWLWWNLRVINVYLEAFVFVSTSIMTMSIWYSTLFALCSTCTEEDNDSETKKIYTKKSMNTYSAMGMYEYRTVYVCALVFGFRAVCICSGKESVKTFQAWSFFHSEEKKKCYIHLDACLFSLRNQTILFFGALNTDNLWINYFVLILS